MQRTGECASFVCGMQGDVKVAVLLIGEEHVTRKTPQKLLGVYQVCIGTTPAKGVAIR